MATLTPQQTLAAAMLRVINEKNGMAPYYGITLLGLIRKETDEVPTQGVSKDGILFWNAKFWERIDVVQGSFELMHEALHILLDHFRRAEALGIAPESPDFAEKAKLANFAQDACIYEILEPVAQAHSYKFPKDWITPESLGQPRGLTWEERYKLLLQQPRQKRPQAGKGCGSGQCGSCAAGKPAPGEPASDASGRPEGRSPVDMDRIRYQTAAKIQAEKSRGNVAAELARWADAILKPPRIDWRVKLPVLVREAVSYKVGSGFGTYLRPSRLQGGLGHGPGVPRLRGKHRPLPRVAVAVDTSGSMSKDDLSDAMTETSGLLETLGADVLFAVCDARLHGLKPVKDVREAVGMLKGGGGTDLRPAFKAIEKEGGRDVVIVFTDGQLGSGCPKSPPPGVQVIWVLIGDGAVQPCTWGDFVFLSEQAEERAAA